MPTPNMFSVLAEEDQLQFNQLMSHGTADLLLDTCTDYWDGKDIGILSESDRNKILDFYQRTSMSAYCTAFAYRPLSARHDIEKKDIYIEIPEGATIHDHDSVSMKSSLSVCDDIDDKYGLQSHQIFIGMITMQYQAQEDIVGLIEELERACIRFVHFSKENELRSRVFSEKMGLEAGWNCHISLENSTENNFESIELLAEETQNRTSIDEKLNEDYGLMNRAKLPRGIKNVRPHLKTVDNVPLLVSLFTDCTPDTIREMIEILQENNDVAVCMGSSVSSLNSSCFLRADASIAIEPLYPSVCLQRNENNKTLLPQKLQALLNSLPCVLSCHRSDKFDFIKLIALSRHWCEMTRRTLQFFFGSYAALSLLQILAAILWLPPILGLDHVLWITLVVIPLISVSGIRINYDKEYEHRALGKRYKNLVNFLYAAWLVGIRFLPILIICLICHGVNLFNFCKQIQQTLQNGNETNYTHNCHVFLGHKDFIVQYSYNGWLTGL